jgi:S-DNA-T family DNA segregation ATPase FtsK/SpoIIIE
MDSARLRELYRSILTAEEDAGANSYSASEATQDFLARLRISVIADEAPPPDPRDGRPYDIVFSQDVISRHAVLEWHAESARPAEQDELLSHLWSFVAETFARARADRAELAPRPSARLAWVAWETSS